MKKLLLTISEFTNGQGEVKKKRANVGRVHSYDGGGEALVLDAAMCAVIGAMGQAALNKGEDSVWVSIFEEDQNKQQGGYQQQAPQPQMQQPQYQQPAQQMQQPAPQPYQNNGSVNF